MKSKTRQPAGFALARAAGLTLGWLVLLAAAAAAQPADTSDPEATTGPGESEMVLIHGLGSKAKVWDQFSPYLQGMFKVRTFELAGHGDTPPVPEPTIASEVVRLESFLAETGFLYPVLVGHGLGGMVALQFALEHPGSVRRLVLMDAAPVQLAGDEEKAEVKRRLREDYDRFVAERFLNMSPDDDVTADIVDAALRTDKATFISLLESSLEYDVTDELPGLTVPLLVIGSQLMFPGDSGNEHLLEHYGFGNARSLSFKRIPGVGHYMMLERDVYTASVILAFAAVNEKHFQR